MKIEVPKILKPMQLSEYAEAFGERAVMVWVNPPVGEILEFIEISKQKDNDEEQARRALEIIAGWWSQGDETWDVEDLISLAKETAPTDPLLWPWMRNRTVAMIFDHRRMEKKS